MKEVVIVAAVRTPMGSFGGVLSTLAAQNLEQLPLEEH